MLKKTIKFQDLDGNELTKDFYFNLSEGELVRKNLRNMTLNDSGEPDVEAFKAQLNAIIQSKSGRVIMDTFEDIIRESYGERDEDGITFHKSPERSARFMNTGAYDVLFMEVVTNAGAAAEFVNGIMPKSLSDVPVVDTPTVTLPQATAPRTPLGLPKQLTEMSGEELLAAVKAGTLK